MRDVWPMGTYLLVETNHLGGSKSAWPHGIPLEKERDRDVDGTHDSHDEPREVQRGGNTRGSRRCPNTQRA